MAEILKRLYKVDAPNFSTCSQSPSYLQWLPLENQPPSLVYVISCHFSRHSADAKRALLAHIHHILELSTEVLYNPVTQWVSKNMTYQS